MPISRSARAAARDRSRRSAFVRCRDRLGIYASSWCNIQSKLLGWQTVCKAFFTAMMACAFCGVVHLGPNPRWYSQIPATVVAPAAQANNFLDDFVTHAGCYILCPSCQSRGNRHHYNPYHANLYTQTILSVPPMTMQFMSLLDLNMDYVRQNLWSFTFGQHIKRSLIEYPLIAWTEEARGPLRSAVPDAFKSVFEANLRTNPLLKFFKTMFEMPEDAQNVPVVRANFIEAIIKRARDRGPLVMAESNLMPHSLSASVSHSPHLVSHGSKTFKTGRLHFRPSEALVRSSADTTQLLEVSDALRPTEPVSECPVLTLECALFPHLFPHGEGCFDGRIQFHHYLLQRANQLFSLFTMFKPYFLLMMQIRQALLVVHATTELVLEREMDEYRRKYRSEHGMSPPEVLVLKNAMKWSVPSTVANSPGWHCKQLLDLMALVRVFGMPHLFLTLTSDESSEFPWEEYDDLHGFLQRFFQCSVYLEGRSCRMRNAL